MDNTKELISEKIYKYPTWILLGLVVPFILPVLVFFLRPAVISEPPLISISFLIIAISVAIKTITTSIKIDVLGIEERGLFYKKRIDWADNPEIEMLSKRGLSGHRVYKGSVEIIIPFLLEDQIGLIKIINQRLGKKYFDTNFYDSFLNNYKPVLVFTSIVLFIIALWVYYLLLTVT